MQGTEERKRRAIKAEKRQKTGGQNEERVTRRERKQRDKKETELKETEMKENRDKGIQRDRDEQKYGETGIEIEGKQIKERQVQIEERKQE